MPFSNELTFFKYIKNDKGKSFNQKYDNATKMISSQFGQIYPLIIDNKKITTDNVSEVVSPIDRRISLGKVQNCTLRHSLEAINCAYEAYKSWSNVDYKRRVKILTKVADGMRSKKFELSAWITYENGKNRIEAMADVDEGIDFILYYCNQIEQNNGFIKNTNSVDKKEHNKVVMKPYGVWGIISPFNFPVAILVGMSVGALITGNTIVVKPSSLTPIVAYKIIEIMIENGLPSGVANYITGNSKEIGKTMIQNPKISGIAFTGSKEIGHKLMRESAMIKSRPLIAELGGKNPTIVTENANIDSAVTGVVQAAFSYSGQKCSACSRIYLQNNIKEKFIKKLVEKTKNITIGNPLYSENYLGPIINSEAHSRYIRYIRSVNKYGKVLTGGSTKKENDLKYGYYVEPTIIEVNDTDSNHILFQQELFLPILCIFSYEKLSDAIKKCNSSEYGLTAGLYSKNKSEINEFLTNIESGVVYVNRPQSSTTGAMVGCQSFGGWKDSGTTGKGSGGPYYLTQFMREQSQTIIQ